MKKLIFMFLFCPMAYAQVSLMDRLPNIQSEWLGKNIATTCLKTCTQGLANDLKISEPQLRIIRPTSMVTMDYSPERLNLHLDNQSKIIDITIG